MTEAIYFRRSMTLSSVDRITTMYTWIARVRDLTPYSLLSPLSEAPDLPGCKYAIYTRVPSFPFPSIPISQDRIRQVMAYWLICELDAQILNRFYIPDFFLRAILTNHLGALMKTYAYMAEIYKFLSCALIFIHIASALSG